MIDDISSESSFTQLPDDAAPHRSSGEHAMMCLTTQIDSDRRLVPLVRHAVAEYAKSEGEFTDEALADIELAVGEALANAVEHGAHIGGWISARCVFHSDTLQVTIRDNGPGFDFATPATPLASHDRQRGFGIDLMRRTMDRVSFRNGGRAVVLSKGHA